MRSKGCHHAPVQIYYQIHTDGGGVGCRLCKAFTRGDPKAPSQVIIAIQIDKFELRGTACTIIRYTVRTNPRHPKERASWVVPDECNTHLIFRTQAKLTSVFVVTSGSKRVSWQQLISFLGGLKCTLTIYRERKCYMVRLHTLNESSSHSLMSYLAGQSRRHQQRPYEKLHRPE